MRILLLGPNGQVGWELQRSLSPLGELVAMDRRNGGDLTDLDGLVRTIETLRPDLIVNAAAYTAVDKAESEPELAHTINARAPAVLAQAAQAGGALLVHYSTDYVFDGSGTAPWTEDAPTGPLNVYGQSKLEGEKAIQASGCRHLIFRTSWVYAARGGNFAKTMLRLAQEREQLTVIDDQWGAPTGADLIADVTAHALRQVQRDHSCSGLHHLAAAGETSWHGYASFVLQTARSLQPDLLLKAQAIKPVPSTAFATAARRPLNSRLNTSRLRNTFALTLPPWQSGVQRMLVETMGI
jgi:dTDP-4-dehydrorhamnose reductase